MGIVQQEHRGPSSVLLLSGFLFGYQFLFVESVPVLGGSHALLQAENAHKIFFVCKSADRSNALHTVGSTRGSTQEVFGGVNPVVIE